MVKKIYKHTSLTAKNLEIAIFTHFRSNVEPKKKEKKKLIENVTEESVREKISVKKQEKEAINLEKALLPKTNSVIFLTEKYFTMK